MEHSGRRVGSALTLAMALVLVMGAAVATAAPPDPFRGAWTSTDVVDDSSQRLTFGGGGDTRTVRLFDADATVACGGGPVIARGVGSISGDTLTVEFSFNCASGAEPGPFTVEYTAVDGTLEENISSTVWTRP